MSLPAKKFLAALLLVLAAALPARGETGLPYAASEDAYQTPPSYGAAYAKVRICVLAVCEEDPATEAAIKRAAETALLHLEGVAVSDFLEESSVLISFVAFKERDAQGMQTGRIVYSFAYGTPDLAYEGGEVIALPRYLHHEPVLAAREMLEKTIAEKIGEADRDFFCVLRTWQR